MKLREIKVQNFRCLADVTIPIGDTTVLVGANNSGKTALLDALRIALTGKRANRGAPFDEYDYHMSKVGDSPQTSQGIVIRTPLRNPSVQDGEEKRFGPEGQQAFLDYGLNLSYIEGHEIDLATQAAPDP
jgi:putative ATP-dependent endonuclease of OLD family